MDGRTRDIFLMPFQPTRALRTLQSLKFALVDNCRCQEGCLLFASRIIRCSSSPMASAWCHYFETRHLVPLKADHPAGPSDSIISLHGGLHLIVRPYIVLHSGSFAREVWSQGADNFAEGETGATYLKAMLCFPLLRGRITLSTTHRSGGRELRTPSLHNLECRFVIFIFVGGTFLLPSTYSA